MFMEDDIYQHNNDIFQKDTQTYTHKLGNKEGENGIAQNTTNR